MGTVNEHETRVGIAPGPGVVGRFGASIVVLAPTGPEPEPFTTGLLDRVARWAAAEPGTATAVAWELAGLLSAHRATAPAWGAAIRVAGGYLVLLHGPVRAFIDTAARPVELTGRRAATWLEHLAEDPVNRIALTLSEAGEVRVDPRSDLRGGVVPGASGLVLVNGPLARPEGAPLLPAPSPISPPRVAPSPAFNAPAAPPAAPSPSAPSGNGRPLVAPPPAAASRSPFPVEPQRRHPEPPTSEFPVASPRPDVPPPSWPTTRLAEETQVVNTSVAALVADDGTRTLLDRDYVFGRDPQHDPAVARGAATPIVVRDPDNLVSRVQAYVGVTAGVVSVRDAGSANGTFIAAPGADGWTVVQERPAVLPEGWSMRLGARVFTHAPALK